jgi:hypothetical protein
MIHLDLKQLLICLIVVDCILSFSNQYLHSVNLTMLLCLGIKDTSAHAALVFLLEWIVLDHIYTLILHQLWNVQVGTAG